MLHLRFDGRSYDLPARPGDFDTAFTDDEIKARVAKELDVTLARLEGYVVDRSPTGDVIVRPEAVYG